MKNNKVKIISVVAILLVVIAIFTIIKINSNDVVEPTKIIETEYKSTPPLTQVVKEEVESIDNFIMSIGVVPEDKQEDKLIRLTREEIVFVEPVLFEKEEPIVEPEEEIEPTEAPKKDVEPTSKPKKEEVKATPTPEAKEEVKVTPTPTKKPEKEEVKVTPTPNVEEEVKASGSIKVAGIDFPLLDKFNTSTLSNGRWGNGDESEEAINKFNEYIYSKKESRDVGIFVSSDKKLIMTHLDSTAPSLELTKWEDENYYKITLNARLKQTAYDDDDTIAKLNSDALLMFCSLVSGTPKTLYDKIYNTAEGNDKDISESYQTFGDFQIKYSVANDKKSISYYVKAK